MTWEHVGELVYMIMPMHEEWKAWTCTCWMNMHDAFLNDYVQLCIQIYVLCMNNCGTCTFECKCMYVCKVNVSAWEACIV